MHDIAEFLRRKDPFSQLDEEALERLAERAEVEFHAAGDVIFEQGDRAQTKVRVVRKGAVELVDQGRVVDVLGEGELFGHPSMLSGLPTGFGARAREDSLVYALAAPDVLPLLARPASLPYLARSLVARRRAGGIADVEGASAEMAQQRARDLIRRPPLVVAPDTAVRDVARQMSEEASSSALVRADGAPGGLGIVTDSDLRARVVADGLPNETPVGEVMTEVTATAAPDDTGADLMLKMLDNDIRHVPVISHRGEPLGVVVAVDLVAAETRTPFVLRRAIAQADTKEELRDAAGRLHSTVAALFRAGLSPHQISEMISVVADALVRRMIELAISAEGPPPLEFAWLALGSHGRHEPVPSSDVDSGMAWRDLPESESGGRRALSSSGVERYMQGIAADVADCVRVCGWRIDAHGVTGGSDFSASSIGDWRRSIESWLQHPDDNRVLIATSILLDARTVHGPEELNPKAFFREAGGETLVRWMLRLALAAKPPTGFMRDIVVEHSGEHRGTLDIKHAGLLPVIDIARYGALKAGVDATLTIERLRLAAEEGALKADHARVLDEAYDLFAALRLEHQVEQLERRQAPDDHIDPKQLNPLTRRYLRDAFREVAEVQKALSGQLGWQS